MYIPYKGPEIPCPNVNRLKAIKKNKKSSPLPICQGRPLSVAHAHGVQQVMVERSKNKKKSLWIQQ